MHSVEGTVTGFDILNGELKYLGFNIGSALEPVVGFLTPIISAVSEWVQEHPKLRLTGKGVIIGFVDTGIDYTNSIFINSNKKSKIVSIWDQNTLGKAPQGFLYGTEYNSELINQALE